MILEEGTSRKVGIKRGKWKWMRQNKFIEVEAFHFLYKLVTNQIEKFGNFQVKQGKRDSVDTLINLSEYNIYHTEIFFSISGTHKKLWRSYVRHARRGYIQWTRRMRYVRTVALSDIFFLVITSGIKRS